MDFYDKPMRAVRDFTYLLNAMERAAQADNPATQGYAEKRWAVLRFVQELATDRPGPDVSQITEEGRNG